MKTKFCFLALSLLIATAYSTVEFEEGVALLTDDNFQSVLDDNEFVFVKFFAPWCGHCKKMKPDFISAAELYEGEDAETAVVFGDLDATVHGDTARLFGVSSYQTLKLFVNGEPIDFKGGRDEDGIIEWIEKKLTPATKELNSLAELEAAMEANRVLVLLFGEAGSTSADVVEVVAKNFDTIAFYQTNSGEVAAEFSLEENAVLILKQFDEGRNDFEGDFSAEALRKFVSANRWAIVMEFNDDVAGRIFQDEKKKTLFLFVDDDDEGQAARNALQEASGKLKKALLLTVCDASEKESDSLFEFFGVQNHKLPQVRLYVPSNSKKYKMDDSKQLTKKGLVTFYNRYRRRKIKPYLKSEPVPVHVDGVVKLVGDNFKDIVMNKKQDVFVKYYAPWCGHCKKLAPIWDDLAASLSAVDNLVIAKMDSTANEVDGISVSSYPTLIYYPANKKGKGITHEGVRQVDDFVEWLQEKSSKKVNWAQMDLDLDDDDEEDRKTEL